MWWLIIKAIIQAVAMIVIGELLRPKPKFEDPKPSSLGDFNFPTAQEGRAIPIFWGTVKCAGPNVTWYGDLNIVPIKKKQKTGIWSSAMVTVGYRYYLGIQHSLAFGCTDGAATHFEFLGIRIEGKDVVLDDMEVTNDYTRFTMNSPTLYGKVDEAGGVTGSVICYHGTFTQPANEYLRNALGEDEIPAYRPLIHVIYERCWLGNNGSLQPPEFLLRRTPNPLALTGGAHNIGGDANPANMVYEILTDRTWGMGIPAALIDVDDFRVVGQTLAGETESLGLSMLVDNTQSGDRLIAEILRHIDGVLYQDFESGLFRIALVRNDYDEETAPVFDETNIVSGSFEFGRSSWEDTQNTVMVRYMDRAQNFTERVLQHQNLANIAARSGQIEAEEYDFLGVSNPTAANVIAARVLRTVSSPLSKVNFDTNRAGTQLRPGSVFRLSWPALGITSIVYRATEIDYGTLESPNIRVTAVEDIFSLSSVAYTAPSPSGWVNPVQPPQPLAAQRLFEAPIGLVGSDLRLVMTLGVRAGGQDLGYLVYSDPTGGTTYTEIGDVSALTPSGLLVADYGSDTHALDTVGFTIEDTDGLLGLVAANATQFAQGDNLLVIDDEILAWTDLEDNGDGTWTVTGIAQAVLDTLPARHLAGARVWFLTGGFGFTSTEPYTSNVTVRTKLLPYTVRSTLAIGSATAMTLTTDSRTARPYPPGGVTVNGAYFRDAEIAGAETTLVLAWNHRDRLQQIEDTVVLAGEDASVGPEAGVTYTLKLYNAVGVLVRTVSALAAAGYTWSTEAADSGLPGDYVCITFAGANGSTVVLDGTGNAWTAMGNTQMLSGLMEFDGTGDWLTTPDDTSWNLSGAFCLEVIGVTFDSLATGRTLLSHYDAYSPGTNQRGWWWYVATDGKIGFVYSTGGTSGTTTTLLTTASHCTTGVEYDLTVSRDASGNLYFFKDGVLLQTMTGHTWSTFNGNSPLAIGSTNTQQGSGGSDRFFLDGRMRAVRFTTGSPRYTTNYPVPALPLVADPYQLNHQGRVVIETWRDGVTESLQTYDFNWTRPDATPPTFYITTEAGDYITTEAGDRIIME